MGLFLTVGSVWGQEIAGTWQGTLEVDGGVRVMLKVSKVDDGKLKADFYNVDQDGYGRATSSIAREGATFRFAIAPADVSFEGKVSGDGGTIIGSLREGGRSVPLTLVRANSDTAWKIEPPKAMAKTADPSFDVATIKPSDPKNGSSGFHAGNGRRINCDNMTGANLMKFAWGLHAKQIVGAPDWFYTERWDVDGFPDVAGIPDYVQMQGMYRKLMEERFGLKFHRETRVMPAYALVVSKDGPKLTKSLDQDAMSDTTYTEWSRQRRVLRVTDTTMKEFVATLNFDLQKPVVDRTELSGRWDFLLRWRPDDAPETSDLNALPGLFTAIQEQAGLKLDSATLPVEVLVIEHVASPSAN